MLCCTIFAGCSANAENDSDNSGAEASAFELRILNRSQFALEHVFVYRSDTSYQQAESWLSHPLGVEQAISRNIKPGRYRVTVTHVEHAGGKLLAYTSGPELQLEQATLLEFLDSIFRQSPL